MNSLFTLDAMTKGLECPDLSRRNAIRGLAALPFASLAGLAWAQDRLPAGSINLIVPFATGGTSDIIARTLANTAARQTGGIFVVENRAGAAGAIGLKAVVGAPADGRSLLLGNIATQTIAPHLYKKVGYPTVQDFRPLALTGRTTNVVVVHPSSGIRDFKGMDAALKAPQAPSYGIGSIGGSPHLSFELLKQRRGWTCEYVPYKGAGPMITDLLGGHVKIAIDNLPTMLPLIQRGAVVPIGITSGQRWSEAKDIPTFTELGIADYDVDAWFGVFAPKGLPDGLAAKYADVFRAAQEEPEVRDKFKTLGARIDTMVLDRFAAFVNDENKRWSEVIQKANIKVE